MIRVLELFAGIGACSKALTNLGIELSPLMVALGKFCKTQKTMSDISSGET